MDTEQPVNNQNQETNTANTETTNNEAATEQTQPETSVIPETPIGPVPLPKKKKSKKKLLITVIILILLAAAASAYFFVIKKSDKPTNSQQSSTQTQQTTDGTTSPGPDTVVYMSGTGLESPLSIFWRPAGGGEKTESKNLGKRANVTQHILKGQKVAFVSEISTDSTDDPTTASTIWYSSDGGKTYAKIFDSAPANKGGWDQITSMIFADDEKSIIFGLLPEGANKNTVKQVLLDKPYATKDFLISDERGVFLSSFNPSTNELAYVTGCYNCDGGGGSSGLLTNVATKVTRKQDSIIKDKPGFATDETIESPDKKETLVLWATVDPTMKVANNFSGDIDYQGPPYILSKVDNASGKETQLITFGKKGSINSQGEQVADTARIGYMSDGKTPYYYVNNQLYSVIGAKSTLLFEASKSIMDVYFVSDSAIYISTGVYNNFVLSKYDVSVKQTTTILNGDDKTTIFGLTTK